MNSLMRTRRIPTSVERMRMMAASIMKKWGMDFLDYLGAKKDERLIIVGRAHFESLTSNQ